MARIQKESQSALATLRSENERLASAGAYGPQAGGSECGARGRARELALRESKEKAEQVTRRTMTRCVRSDLGLAHDLQARERAIIDLKAERDALGRLLSEVEREAFARGERARQLKVSLAERERELETLRVELSIAIVAFIPSSSRARRAPSSGLQQDLVVTRESVLTICWRSRAVARSKTMKWWRRHCERARSSD